MAQGGGYQTTYGTSWADQWDYGQDPAPTKPKSNVDKGKKKAVEVAGKTKEAAVVGYKKVKEGAISGFHWIKDKYNKRTQKH